MLNFILYGIAISAQLLLCFLVYYAIASNEKSVQKKLLTRFYFLSASTILWSLTQSAYEWSNNLAFQGFLLRAGAVATILTGLSFLTFTFSLVGKHRLKRDILYFPLITSAVLVSVFDNFFNVSLDSSGVVVYGYNFLTYGFVTLVPILLILRAVVLLFVSRKRTKQDIKKRQYTAMLHGMLVSASIAFLGNFLLAYFLGESSFTSAIVVLTPVVFTGSIVYAVFSLKMFNFRKFFTRVLIYGAVFISAYSAAFFAVGYLAEYFNLGNRVTVAVLLPVSLLIFIASSWVSKNLINHLSRSGSVEYSSNHLRSAMRTISSVKLLEGVADIVRKAFGFNKCAFVFLSEDGVELWRESNSQSQVTKKPGPEMLKNLLKSNSDSIEEIGPNSPLASFGFSSIIFIKRQGVKGAMLVGDKVSGRPIYSDEIPELKKIAFEVALGIENTLQFEKITKFNQELEQKIQEATSKLRRTNDKLKALDEAKDEFISMASHQLRTPLTSIKGYISLILDGDMGKVPTKQRKMLSEAFSSSQRMVYLISDLLNVSRLRTGKFMIEPVDVYLPEVVEDEIDQVKEMAEVKNIKINFEKPKSFAHIDLDDMKIRQVIMNFIDNAIHYTPEGGDISVELREGERSLEFRVIDSGIGVPKAEQHHLFTKFYRAGNARKARPDGTGLGLFMAKKVIVASGGSIIFNSEEGKGSTFGFIFPKKPRI